ncbi:DNA polymerase III subunit delta [Gimibacter soli]|uniref:DNA-directed DNA polymerase n=1 Tax=Gimibacter soli TaxID=3024400 RepID=A0AAE9XQR4_9PROT|nr:DNA polymerase III subunit delta [Gimibacter soli]WCL54626.1 DNA polymerase III subunit delta [Gimibacter soli]
MKVAPRDIEAVCRSLPAGVRVVLVYGRDEGLARERATRIGKQIAPDLSDPFQVARPDNATVKATPSLLVDEMSAISMLGGRRLVRLEGAGNDMTDAVKLVLADPRGDGLLLITAGDLDGGSSLRKAVEGGKDALAIACYEDNARDLSGLVQEVLSAAGLRASRDAMAYLIENLGGDRAVSRGELDKLVLYKGNDKSEITLDDARACVGDTAAFALHEIASAVTAGDMKKLETGLERAWIAGESPIAILLLLSRRLMRLHYARALMTEQNLGPAEAVERLRPPVIFFEKPVFTADLARWTARKIEQALDILIEADLECKTTGNPAEVICARACLRLAKAAR